jgi:hypothetical protein
LQEAKKTVIDRYWSLSFPITEQMKTAARLAIDRELRNEPLEEWAVSEVSALAASIRDRLYLSVQREAEDAAKKTLEQEKQDLAKLLNRKERTKRKDQWMDEALRRLGREIRIHAISPLDALQAIGEARTQLDLTLTGEESLAEAYAAIDAVIHSRVAEWRSDQESREQCKQEKWIEGATAVGILIGFCFLYVYSPQIFRYLVDIFFSANQSGAAPKSPPRVCQLSCASGGTRVAAVHRGVAARLCRFSANHGR